MRTFAEMTEDALLFRNKKRISRHTEFEVIPIKQLKKYLIIGIFFVLTLGSLSHFFYEWSNHSFLVGLFTPVSESVWEHMKLIFFPMLLYSFIIIPKCKAAFPCITSAFLSGILAGTTLMPVIFYTYTGILGFHTLILDIGTFALSSILAFFIACRLALSCRMKNYVPYLYAAICLFVIFFFVFSCCPPDAGLFLDPAAAS